MRSHTFHNPTGTTAQKLSPILTRMSGVILLFMLFWSCSSSSSPEMEATLAARDYYQHLVDNDVDLFLSGKCGSDSLPTDYNRQLQQAVKLFLCELEKKHGGILSVAVSSTPAQRDTLPTNHPEGEAVVYAYLLLHFKDSTSEEVVVPMVEKQGKWKMR